MDAEKIKQTILQNFEEYIKNFDIHSPQDFLTFMTIVNIFLDYGENDGAFKDTLKDFINTVLLEANKPNENCNSKENPHISLDYDPNQKQNEKEGIYVRSINETINNTDIKFHELDKKLQKLFSYQVLCLKTYNGYESREI